MINTKHRKVKFSSDEIVRQNAQGYDIQMKIIKKEKDGSLSSGYCKVDFEKQKWMETYKKINKLLGSD